MKTADEGDIVSLVSDCGGEHSSACGYCGSSNGSYSYGLWAHQLTVLDYQELLDRGWRRSGNYLYKPTLEKSCCCLYTIRLPVERFSLSNSQKKVLKKFTHFLKFGRHDSPISSSDNNVTITSPRLTSSKSLSSTTESGEKSFVGRMNDLIVSVDERKHRLDISLEKPILTMETFELFKKYQKTIHHDSERQISEKKFREFLIDTPLQSKDRGTASHEYPPSYGSYHQYYRVDGKLIAVGIVDLLPKCLSSVYFFYDPDYNFLSLGVFSALYEIFFVQEIRSKVSEDLSYYYLGFYIDTCEKMRYKAQYRPSQLLDPFNYNWVWYDQCIEAIRLRGLTPLNLSKEILENEDAWRDIVSQEKTIHCSIDSLDLESVILLIRGSFYTSKSLMTRWEDLKDVIENFVHRLGPILSKRIVLRLADYHTNRRFFLLVKDLQRREWGYDIVVYDPK